MRVFVVKDYEDMSRQAARFVAEQVAAKPDSVLGLATGSTPLLMYRYLIDLCREAGVSFSRVTTFNLDEYVGLRKTDENSYYYYMYNHLFNFIDIRPDNIHIPNGMAADIEEECREYDQRIQQCGGIDLQVLGIGQNGHIGFNEPGVKFDAGTHQVRLNQETIKANSRFFSTVQEVPRHAVSMGIKNIMQARRILLLANGNNKAQAVYQALCGEITPNIPASVLQLHPDVTVIVEAGAADFLPDSLPENALFGSWPHDGRCDARHKGGMCYGRTLAGFATE
ncbi:Glucosamine-6-phosphate deaminase [Propionispora sp. 2/2-37]|uniref:glucosamine-6-phosphate deaminase n=1 Tax=Propionispora sp. 2/2-37 TaxID=1677858 RepID=UPI0006C5066E|nr:glucosamine-6-phosphate deaminase [Propionispora sp. 2/2-37]CUH95593.1 Glucosamine-6-phosphate deaminase [Propionispora sp. 2/2-37]